MRMKTLLCIISFTFFYSNIYAQEGGLKNVIIKYDTTYECNNMHESAAITDVYLDKGLMLYVYDGPYLISHILEKKNNIEDGISLAFYIPSNMPKEKGFFLAGEKDKVWYYWKINGELSKKEFWRRGKLLKVVKY